jgi:hypothetical protein
LLWLLASRYRRARRVHLVVDNYGIHKARLTRKTLAAFGGRIVLHFLPPYCPDANRIERVWAGPARQRHAQPPLQDPRQTPRQRSLLPRRLRVEARIAPTHRAGCLILFENHDRSFSATSP